MKNRNSLFAYDSGNNVSNNMEDIKEIKNLQFLPFFNRHPDTLLIYAQRNYSFTIEQLKKWRSILNWDLLSNNKNLPWSMDFFHEFDYELTIHKENLTESDIEELQSIESKPGHYHSGIYFNNGIPWSIELIDQIKDKVSWFMISQYWKMDESITNLERYKDYLDWFFISYSWELPWTVELLKKYEDKWDYTYLSHRLIWNPDTDSDVREFLGSLSPTGYYESDMIYQRSVSSHDKTLEKIRKSKTPLTGDDLLYVIENATMYELIYSYNIDWTADLIDYLSDKEDWDEISQHNDIPFTESLIDKYIDTIEFGKHEPEEIKSGISENIKLPWSIRFIEKYKEKWCWKLLSWNQSLPWNEELIDTFMNNWDWETLSGFLNEFWDIEMIKKYSNRIQWNYLSVNESLNFTNELLNEFETYWNYDVFLENETFINQVISPLLTKDIVEDFIVKFL